MSGGSRHTHLYTMAVETEHAPDTYCTAHLVVDRDLNLVRLGRNLYTQFDTLARATRRALRDGISDILSAESPESLTIHEDTLATPELELGRLSDPYASSLDSVPTSITPQTQTHCQELVSALASQQIDDHWYTPTQDDTFDEPFTVYLDGSHKNSTHFEIPNETHGSTTCGYVIVDNSGRVLEVMADRLDDASESLHAEYIALKRGVEAVKQINPTTSAIFKTDTSHLRYTIGAGQEAPPRFRPLAAYIRETLATFDRVTVDETLRDQNMFADALADVAHDRRIAHRPIHQSIDEDTTGYTYSV